MAFYTVVFRGQCGPGDIWNMGHSVTSDDDAAGVGGAVTVAAALLFPASPARHNDTVTVAGVRITERNVVTGVPASAADASFTFTGAGAAGNALPSEVSIVLSQRTALVSRRGRMYTPPTVIGVLTSDGRLAAAQRDIWADAFQDYMQSLLAATPTVVPVVWKRPVAGAGGASSPVTSIDVGDVFDAQRRRRNKLVEARASRTIP